MASGTASGSTSTEGAGAGAGDGPTPFDRLRRRVLWAFPSGLYLLGSRAGERRNLMTLSWATQVAMDRKLVAVSVEREALTAELIASGGVFSISLLRREDRVVVRRFAKPAADDPEAGTLAGHPVRAARTGAPILAAALAWVDCEVRHALELGSHTLFVGEVVDCGAAGEDLDGVLRMEDTRMSYGG
ncbi:MAG TPA: flavin reductase family protein [Acidimicrobiales bacterium]|nr:flavin reductase family protein [Acidimicrobiales bacterium]